MADDAGIRPEEGHITSETDNPSHARCGEQEIKQLENNDGSSNVNLSTQCNDHTPLL